MEFANQEISFQLGLLYLFHLLDIEYGLANGSANPAAYSILDDEGIKPRIMSQFVKEATSKTDGEIYLSGIVHLKNCTPENRLRLCSRLYELADIYGQGMLNELKLILQSARQPEWEVAVQEMFTK